MVHGIGKKDYTLYKKKEILSHWSPTTRSSTTVFSLFTLHTCHLYKYTEMYFFKHNFYFT